jgi:hypothetical protein
MLSPFAACAAEGRPVLRFQCPNCQQILKAPPEWSGRKTKCTRCGQRLLVPAAPPPQNKTVLANSLPPAAPETQAAPQGDLSVNCPGCGRTILFFSHELPLTIECVQCKACFAVQAPGAAPPPSPFAAQAPARPDPFGQLAPHDMADVAARRCPFCAEPISPDAMKCRHCGEVLDPDMRAAKAESEGQADGVGLISITLAALALIATITGLICFGYGTLVGIPIALAGLVVAIFAGKKRKAALILNSAAIVPPVVLGLVVVAVVALFGVTFTSCCCVGLTAPDQQDSPTQDVSPQKNPPQKNPQPPADQKRPRQPGKGAP